MYRVTMIVLLLVLSLALPGFAQKECGDDTIQKDRREARDLRSDGKFSQSIPLWEKVVAACAEDVEALEALGVALAGEAVSIPDAEKAKQIRVRAREYLLRSQKLGNNSNLLTLALEQVPEGGGAPVRFSSHAEAEKAMRMGEAAFARGEYDRAKEFYVQALLIDPNLYSAALFMGDVFYKQNKPGSAGEWFARANQIDPNIETAYRYWGDMLMRNGDMKGAREKFIDAIIAEPYTKASWIGMQQWAQHSGYEKISRPQIAPRSSVTTGEPGADGKGQINITLDGSMFGKKDKDPAGSAWMMYGMSRALWQGEKFKKEFPNEQYRHSLREEMDAFSVVLSTARDKKGKIKTKDASLKMTDELHSKGLLEAHVLFFMADDGIAKDYAAYREKNRDKLRQYLDEYVVPKAK